MSRLSWILGALAVGAAVRAAAKPKAPGRVNPAPSGWLWPVPECERTSSLWGRRPNPFDDEPEDVECHFGLDIPCRGGAPIVASRAGVVTTSALRGSAGNLVEIIHDDGMESRYMHLSRRSVSVGDFVDAGDRIGTVGTTGRSTGNHLHFEVRTVSGRSIDPGPLLGVDAGTPC